MNSIVPRYVEAIKCGLDASNEPRYIRTPEHDAAKGPNSMGGNAWKEISTGKTRLFRKGYDANDSWCGSDLARRKAIDGGEQ
jgi:hypothetical protein